ncbi:Pectin acetylesterase 3 [Diplonema papillatum]|nr:Pectin acetylesterase 3 [Diplonema papillatum]
MSLGLCGVAALVSSSVMHLNLMTDAVADGAVCLSGDPGGYMFGAADAPVNANDWMIYFEGGGWCYDPRDCFHRAGTSLGNSSHWPTSEKGFGLMSDNCTVNPLFCNYNHVNIKYCDGNSFAGNADEPMVYNGTKLYLRGKRILDAALSHLARLQNLSNAENVLLTGCSAGGLATYLHVEYVHDWFKENAPNLKRFKAAPMSGFFLDHDSVYGVPAYETEMKNIHLISNASAGGGLNAACVEHYAPSGEDWKCNFAQYTYDFIDTPLFVLNSGLDAWQTKCIVTAAIPYGFPNQTNNGNGQCNQGSYAACERAPDTQCNATEIVQMNQYTTDFMAALSNSTDSRQNGHGSFIHSCHTHCEAQNDDYFATFAVDGVTMRGAVFQWWSSSNEPSSKHSYAPCLRKTGNVADRQCNPSCQNSSLNQDAWAASMGWSWY